MRSSRPILLAGCLVVSVFLSESAVTATVVDFNGIPDGTPVSAGNPYGGILNLQAIAQWMTLQGTFSAEGTIIKGAPFYPPDDGVVKVIPLVGFPDAGGLTSDVTGNFLQPVNNVMFDVFVFRNASYSYAGANGLGDIFNGGGIITGNLESGGVLTWQQISLNLPIGYTLTTFNVHNADPASPSDAAVWLDNVAFAVVPEPSTAAMFGGGVMLVVIVRRRRTG